MGRGTKKKLRNDKGLPTKEEVWDALRFFAKRAYLYECWLEEKIDSGPLGDMSETARIISDITLKFKTESKKQNIYSGLSNGEIASLTKKLTIIYRKKMKGGISAKNYEKLVMAALDLHPVFHSCSNATVKKFMLTDKQISARIGGSRGGPVEAAREAIGKHFLENSGGALVKNRIDSFVKEQEKSIKERMNLIETQREIDLSSETEILLRMRGIKPAFSRKIWNKKRDSISVVAADEARPNLLGFYDQRYS